MQRAEQIMSQAVNKYDENEQIFNDDDIDDDELCRVNHLIDSIKSVDHQSSCFSFVHRLVISVMKSIMHLKVKCNEKTCCRCHQRSIMDRNANDWVYRQHRKNGVQRSKDNQNETRDIKN